MYTVHSLHRIVYLALMAAMRALLRIQSSLRRIAGGEVQVYAIQTLSQSHGLKRVVQEVALAYGSLLMEREAAIRALLRIRRSFRRIAGGHEVADKSVQSRRIRRGVMPYLGNTRFSSCICQRDLGVSPNAGGRPGEGRYNGPWIMPVSRSGKHAPNESTK